MNIFCIGSVIFATLVVNSAAAQESHLAPAPATPATAALTSAAPVNPAGFKNLTVDEFAQMATNHTNVVLDVRTPQEFAAGHLPGAQNLDVNGVDFDQRVAALDNSRTYLVHCAAGGRSVTACKAMGHLGFPHLYNLSGGFKAWVKAGKPVEK